MSAIKSWALAMYLRWCALSLFVKLFWVFTVAYLFTMHQPFYMCALFTLLLHSIKELEKKVDALNDRFDDHIRGGGI